MVWITTDVPNVMEHDFLHMGHNYHMGTIGFPALRDKETIERLNRHPMCFPTVLCDLTCMC